MLLRRDSPPETPQVRALVHGLDTGDIVVTTGLVLQELLQGFSGPKAREQILDRFSQLPLLAPDRQDHIQAAELRNRCRRAGVQVATIDALYAQLCIHHGLTMLSADKDFENMAGLCALRIWQA